VFAFCFRSRSAGRAQPRYGGAFLAYVGAFGAQSRAETSAQPVARKRSSLELGAAPKKSLYRIHRGARGK